MTASKSPTNVNAPVAMGGVNVTIQGSTNMGAADISRATQQGVGMGADQFKEALRDFSFEPAAATGG